MRVVLDTNVLLATSTRGLCHDVVKHALRAHTVVLSEFILGEVQRHLKDKFKASADDAAFFVSVLRSQVELVIPAPVRLDACRDADDCVVLGTAVAAGAECLVTGDQDLLSLRMFEGIPILSPRAFYERVR